MKPLSPFRLIPLLLLFLLAPLPCFAALVTVTSVSHGVYSLNGEGLSDITALDISLDYDPTTLSNPRISPALLAARSTLEKLADGPGSLRFTITRQAGAINGSGQLAQITFDVAGQGPGAISGLSAGITDKSGGRSSAETRIDEPSNQDGNPGRDRNAGGSSTTPSSGPASVEDSGQTGPQRGRGGHMVPTAPFAAGGMAFQAVAGVLDHVRHLGEGKDVNGLLALFAQGAPPGLRQEPAVCLSDGRTRVRLTVIAASSGQQSPYFVLSGARFLSLKNSNGRIWTLEALPDAGAYQASLMVVSGGGSTVYPLTVAPPSPVDPTLAALPGKKQATALAAALGGIRVPGNGELPEHVRRYILAANLLAGKSDHDASAHR